MGADSPEKQTADLLKAARDIPQLSAKLSFEKLLLKFPQLEDGFLRLQNAFSGVPLDSEATVKISKQKAITQQQARAAQGTLGFLLDEHAQRLHCSGLDGSVLFPDFVVNTALLLVQMVLAKRDINADHQAAEALKLTISSFNHFDKDGNSTLTQAEVTGTMGEDDSSAHARRVTDPGQGEAGGISLRWQLMDCDKDGRATFRDYVNSLHHWVLEGIAD